MSTPKNKKRKSPDREGLVFVAGFGWAPTMASVMKNIAPKLRKLAERTKWRETPSWRHPPIKWGFRTT
jgi:hypothetical protein